MLEGKLDDLITARHVQAFREFWTVDGEDARQDFLRILSMFSEPLDRNEIEQFVARLVMGLVAERPDPVAWLEALAAGSFAVSKTGPSETPAQLRKRARALARRSGLFLSNIEGYRRAWADDATKSQDEVRLLLAIAVGKELRKNVAAKAALGPAWPLMMAVNDYFTNKEKRALYFYGADNRLQSMIAEAVREALEHFSEYHADPAISPPETADWTREIPPGADIHAYFNRADPPVQNREDERQKGAQATGTTDNSTVQDPAPDDEPSYSYLKMPDGSERPWKEHDERSIMRLKNMMPVLTETGYREREIIALAARAEGRRAFGSLHIRGKFDFALADEVRRWIRSEHLPPADLRPEHAHLFEEEACLAFVNGASLLAWRDVGFFPNARPENQVGIFELLDDALDVYLERTRRRE